MKVEKRGMWADEPIIGTSFQQALDKKRSVVRIFRYHGKMQRCGFIEPIDWVHVAFVVREDAFQRVQGYMQDSNAGVSCAVRYRISSVGISRVMQG